MGSRLDAAREMTAPLSDLSHTAGLVLAGGRSSRFGADKALARFRGDLLLDRACLPFQNLPAIAISAKSGSAVAEYARKHRMQVVADDPHGPDGPLAGVLSGLDWAHSRGFSSLATAPCDAPTLPGDLVATLVARSNGARAAYAETSHGAHPLCAVWSTDIREALRSALEQGHHPSVRDFLARIGARPVLFETASAFANANTRDILKDLERGL